MDFEKAVKRVTKMAARLKAQESLALPQALREEAKADRIALEIVTEWAMKVYEKDKELATQMMNAMHI